MGRKRKFQIGDVVLHGIGVGVVVDWQRLNGKGMYRIVKLSHGLVGRMYGSAAWVLPQELEHSVFPNRFRSTVKIYKANEKLEERGCTCNCCAHVEIPVSDIRSDGTFRWEQDDE